MPFGIDRRLDGPTVGDRGRLGDTNLLVEVARDKASPGDEMLRTAATNRSTGVCCRRVKQPR